MIARIALLGEPGSGKSTVGAAWLARHRVNTSDHRPLQLSFADALKWELAKMLADERFEATDLFAMQKSALTKDRFRSMQQALGQYRRFDNPDYWLNKVLSIIDMAEQADRREGQTTFIVVDDCRFPNEEAALRERGFAFISLASGETTRPLTGAQAADESEAHWRKFAIDAVLPYKKGPEIQAAAIDELLEGAE